MFNQKFKTLPKEEACASFYTPVVRNSTARAVWKKTRHNLEAATSRGSVFLFGELRRLTNQGNRSAIPQNEYTHLIKLRVSLPRRCKWTAIAQKPLYMHEEG